jgi:hypothetical protein
LFTAKGAENAEKCGFLFLSPSRRGIKGEEKTRIVFLPIL